MNGPTAYAAVLFGANSFQEYVAGMQYAENVLHVDMDIVDEIRGLKATVEAQRLAIEARRKALEAQSNEVAKQYARLAGLRSQQAGAKSAVLSEIDYKQHLLARVRKEKRAYAAALQSYLEESDSIAEMLRRAQGGQQAIQGKGGYLKWPVSGPITSDYGWRTHPIYGYKSFHTGIDIGAPSGKTVKVGSQGRGSLRRIQGRLRPRGDHRSRQRAGHDVRAPVQVVRAPRTVSRDVVLDRRGGLHRLVHGPARPLRGARERRPAEPAPLALALR